ncbi:MAG: hypothetical protein PVI63_06740 [Anaerolineae bacterium]|jgi:hypothetical protein
MIARIQTELPSPAEKVWQALLKRDTFLYITRGMLGFQGADQWPEVFGEGLEIETRLVFLHLIPGWKHRLRVVRIDEEKREMASEEEGGLIQQWNHRIFVERVAAQRCRYTDEIDIEAGLLTGIVWVYAHIFYRYRQARWRRLAKGL